MPTRFVVRALLSGAALAFSLGGLVVAPAEGQVPSASRGRAQVQGAQVAKSQSRRQLEARLAQISRDRRYAAEAEVLRTRLRDGDFQVGDAIILNVVNVPQFSDTFTVRAGRTLELPEVPPISLAGVLRTELQEHLRRHIGRYVINPSVEAYSLVRVAVAGGVTRPGFYEVRPDAPITEAVTYAGGFSREGDATKLSVRRAGRTVIPEKELRNYVAMGATLDDLNVRPGDEIRVGERTRRNWLDAARTVAYVAAVAVGLWAGGRSWF